MFFFAEKILKNFDINKFKGIFYQNSLSFFLNIHQIFEK
jgi:hypothetical protein